MNHRKQRSELRSNHRNRTASKRTSWKRAVGETLERRDLLSGMSVISVPYMQSSPDMPHPGHEDGQITLKAIARGVTSGETYNVQWDIDVDGDYDEEFLQTYTATGDTLFDIGRTFKVPQVAADTLLDIGVRIVETSSGEEQFGTFRLYVYNVRPSNDPRNWTDNQLEIIQAMAVQESMWNIHRMMTRTGSGTADIQGHYPSAATYQEATTTALRLFAVNGHYPAYPVGSLDSFGQSLPSEWQTTNDARWDTDPYAESAMRLLNSVAAEAELIAISSGNEGNTSGYAFNGTPIVVNRIPGTTDQQALAIYHNAPAGEGGRTQQQGDAVAAIVSVLPALAGTPVQVGVAAGESWEWFTQQSVDWLSYAQYDVTTYTNGGSWYFNPSDTFSHSGNVALYSNANSFAGAMHGLAEAELMGGPYGVVVDNLHKYGVANPLIFQQNSDGGIGYRPTNSDSNLNYTGAWIEAARWLGVHQFSASDNTVAFPHESNYTRGQLRRAYDKLIQYTAVNFDTPMTQGTPIYARDEFWDLGDYLQGNTNALYNAGNAGDPYNIYLHSRAYQRGEPDLQQVGNNDWNREFATYLSRAQERGLSTSDPLASYDVFGQVHANHRGRGYVQLFQAWGTPLAGLILTPEEGLFIPSYAAIVGPATDLHRHLQRVRWQRVRPSTSATCSTSGTSIAPTD